MTQRTLFGETTPCTVAQRAETLKQCYENGRAARDIISTNLKTIAKLFDENPPSYQVIIKSLEELQHTPAIRTLKDFLKRIGYTWSSDLLEQIQFLLAQAKAGEQSSGPERWHKGCVKNQRESTKTLFFTCCNQRVQFNRWAYLSNRGRVYCRKCFLAHFSHKFEKTVWLITL